MKLSFSDQASSHPTTAHRFLALENTVKEINTKRKKGVPLIPELK